MPEEKINYQVIRNFGPSIFKIKIPKNIIDNLNKYADDILESEEKQKKI